MKYIGIIPLVLLLLACPALGYITGETYYQDITINNAGGSTTAYLDFVVYDAAGSSSGSTIYLNANSQSDIDDLRFTSTSDTEYEYFISNAASPFRVWVKVPSVPSGNSTVRVQYGDPSAAGVASGADTFELFTNCDTVDAAIWEGDTGSAAAGSGIITLTAGGDWKRISTKTAFSQPHTVIMHAAFTADGASKFGQLLFRDSDFTDYMEIKYGDGNRQIASTASSSTTTVSTSLDTSFHTYEFRWSSNSAGFWSDNGKLSGTNPITTHVPTVNLNPCIGAFSNTIRIDYLAVYTPSPLVTVAAYSGESPAPTPTPTPTPTTTPVPAGQIGVYSYESNYIIWSVGPNQTAILLDGVLTNVTNSTSSMVYGQYDLQAGSTHIACPLNGTCVVVNLHDDAVSIWLTWGAYLLLIFLAIISYRFPVSAFPAVIYGIWLIASYLPDIGASASEYAMVGIIIVLSVGIASVGLRRLND